MKNSIEDEIKRLSKKVAPPSDKVNAFLDKMKSTRITTGFHLSELLKRPEITYLSLAEIDDEFPPLHRSIANQVEIQVKYVGYIKRQSEQALSVNKLDKRKISQDINYEDIYGLRTEARQKLSKIKPESVGQASRISGVSPSDIAVLLVYLKGKK